MYRLTISLLALKPPVDRIVARLRSSMVSPDFVPLTPQTQSFSTNNFSASTPLK